MRVIIFRKDNESAVYPPKAAKAVTGAIREALSLVVRVKRHAVVDHFLPTGAGRSAFARQATVTRADLHHLANCTREGVMDERGESILARGWVVPESDLGRAPKNGGERDWNSTAMSILLYVKDRVGVTSLDGGVYTVAPDGSDVSVVIVR